VKIAIDPSGTLYNGQRIRTNDLTITLGAVTTGSDGKPAASQSLNEQHLANLIGRAVADAIQDQR
jgi:hypothetical protein